MHANEYDSLTFDNGPDLFVFIAINNHVINTLELLVRWLYGTEGLFLFYVCTCNVLFSSLLL